MPGLYTPGEYDVAGFAVGIVEREDLLPKRSEMAPNDCVIGLPSSGLHSNGFTLVRKIVDDLGLKYEHECPYDSSKTLGEGCACVVEYSLWHAVLPTVHRSAYAS